MKKFNTTKDAKRYCMATIGYYTDDEQGCRDTDATRFELMTSKKLTPLVEAIAAAFLDYKRIGENGYSIKETSDVIQAAACEILACELNTPPEVTFNNIGTSVYVTINFEASVYSMEYEAYDTCLRKLMRFMEFEH